MKPLRIQQADVYCVGPSVPRCRLAADMGEVYETLTLLHLQTTCGLDGIAGVTSYSENDFDQAIAYALKPLLPEVIGQDAQQSEQLWQHLMTRYNSVTPKPQSLIDIALWDLKAKAAKQPLHRFLGGQRDQIDAYASTPLFDTPAEYIDFVNQLLSEGHRTIKFHVWCQLDKDLALLDAIEQHYGSSLAFMVDLEERYSREDALIIAKRLQSLNCVWLEAPLPDTDLIGYAQLRQQTSVPILPAGNTLVTPDTMQLGLDQNAWHALRCDTTYAGGITGTLKIAALAEQHNKTLELQSWGYTPSQLANLHLMLAIDNSHYFEQPVPYFSHETCCKQVVRTDNGRVQAPEADGLGIEIDWQQVKADCLSHYQLRHPFSNATTANEGSLTRG